MRGGWLRLLLPFDISTGKMCRDLSGNSSMFRSIIDDRRWNPRSCQREVDGCSVNLDEPHVIQPSKAVSRVTSQASCQPCNKGPGNAGFRAPDSHLKDLGLGCEQMASNSIDEGRRRCSRALWIY